MRLRKSEKTAIAAVLAAQNALANKKWYESSDKYYEVLNRARRRACFACGVDLKTEDYIFYHHELDEWLNLFLAHVGEVPKQIEVYVVPSSKEREKIAKLVAELDGMPFSEYINHTTWVVAENYLSKEEMAEYKAADAHSYPMDCEWDNRCGIGGGHHSRTGRHTAPAWAIADFLRRKLKKKWVPTEGVYEQ